MFNNLLVTQILFVDVQVTQYSRFWVVLWNNQLLYFSAKLLSGPEDRQREAYKSDPCKMMPVQGWMVFMCDSPEQPDAFQLTHPVKGTCQHAL